MKMQETSPSTPKTAKYYLCLFCQRTSVRGIPKAESSKNAVIKWFWIVFVVISFVLLIVILTLLILQYLRYDTIIKNSFIKTMSQDFPEITICSKRFYDLEMTENKSPFKYLDEYSAKIYAQVIDQINNGNIDQALLGMKYRYVVSAFYHDQFDFVRNRTYSLVDKLASKCKIRKTIGGRYDNTTVANCGIKAVFNPLFLNCLAFRVPDNYSLNSTRFYMDINITFAQKPNNYTLEKFSMDEYLAEIDGSDGYQDTRLYIHNPSEYPFYKAYESTFDCNNLNSYTVERVDRQALQVTVDSKLNCRSEARNLSSYNVSYSVIRGTLCESLTVQAAVINECGCKMHNMPTDNYLHTTMILCVDNSIMYNCADKISQKAIDSAASNCLQSCNLTYFNVQSKLIPLYVSNFSEVMMAIFDSNDICGIENNDKRAVNACCGIMNVLLSNEFPNLFNRSCPNMFGFTFSDLSTSINSTNQTNINSTNSKQLINNTLCQSIHVKVQIRSEKNLQVETLVIEMNNLLSQLAGMCAFITGFTFTIIGEVLEVFLFRLSERRNKEENKD